MMRGLNLLKYPDLARRQKVLHRGWTGLAGLVLGGLLALGWQLWLVQETDRLHQAQAPLQAALLERTSQITAAGRRQAQAKALAAQGAQMSQIAAHQQTWITLHGALQSQALQTGLRLERLQAEGTSIELHGTLPNPYPVSDALRSLSARLGRAVALVRLSSGAGDATTWVAQVPWPEGIGPPDRPRSQTKPGQPSAPKSLPSSLQQPSADAP